ASCRTSMFCWLRHVFLVVFVLLLITELYPLSLHDALPIFSAPRGPGDEPANTDRTRQATSFSTPKVGEPHRGPNVLHRHGRPLPDRKSTRLNSSHVKSSYAVFCLEKKKDMKTDTDIKP